MSVDWISSRWGAANVKPRQRGVVWRAQKMALVTIVSEVSTSEGAWYGGGYCQLSAGLTLTQGLRIYADGTVLLLASAPGIKVGGRTVGRWGAPAAVASMGFEVSWAR